MDLGIAVQQAVFFMLAAMVLTSALMVILARNPVHSVLYLVMAFVGSAGLWILLEAEFLGLILILVYVGAVMTLFLFVVMMLKVDLVATKKGFVRFLPLAVIVSVILFALMTLAVGPRQFGLVQNPLPAPHLADYSNLKELGLVLYTQYFYPFELAAVILLVALIAAIGLTHRDPQNRKQQIPEQQMLVRKQDRLRIISMESSEKK